MADTKVNLPPFALKVCVPDLRYKFPARKMSPALAVLAPDPASVMLP